MFIITCIAELLQTGYVRMSLLWHSYACLMFHQDGLQENPLVAGVISYSLGTYHWIVTSVSIVIQTHWSILVYDPKKVYKYSVYHFAWVDQRESRDTYLICP